MKIHKQPVFSPITITLETEEEYKTLLAVFDNSNIYHYRAVNYNMDVVPQTEKVMYGILKSAYNQTF